MFECPRCWKVEVHSPGCPARRVAGTSQELAEPAPAIALRAPSEGPVSGPAILGTSAAHSYDGPPRLTTSRRKVGRKPKHASPKIAQREAARAYRARQRNPRQPHGDSLTPQPDPRSA